MPGSPEQASPGVEPQAPSSPERGKRHRHGAQTVASRVAAIVLTGVALYIVLPSLTAPRRGRLA